MYYKYVNDEKLKKKIYIYKTFHRNINISIDAKAAFSPKLL